MVRSGTRRLDSGYTCWSPRQPKKPNIAHNARMRVKITGKTIALFNTETGQFLRAFTGHAFSNAAGSIAPFVISARSKAKIRHLICHRSSILGQLAAYNSAEAGSFRARKKI